MKSTKGHQEEEEEDEELGAQKEATPSNSTKDGKNSDKVNAMRSKHSVTEQRRRSKINERFQILRGLIPRSDQKRDTASFLLEVIEYVQYLQEKVQKYEGSFQGWSSEPTKLMPWRNSHWRIQSFVGHPQAMKNGSGPGSTFPGRFDENNVMSPTMPTNSQSPIESDPSRDASCKAMNQQPELADKAMAMPMPMPMPMPLQAGMPIPVEGDGVFSQPLRVPILEAQTPECPITNDALNQQEEVTIEGGTISISSVYSHGLLNTLTQALQSAGLDLSQATISVQIDLGKRANRELTSGLSRAKDHENLPSGSLALGHFQDSSNVEDSDQSQKRQKI